VNKTRDYTIYAASSLYQAGGASDDWAKVGIRVFMKCCSEMFYNRETREGWPLLTVETEANGVSRSKHMTRGSSMVGLWGLSCRYKRFLSSLALVRPVQNNFSSL
jgi:hypothetical protein